jgi:hypothetical protein
MVSLKIKLSISSTGWTTFNLKHLSLIGSRWDSLIGQI